MDVDATGATLTETSAPATTLDLADWRRRVADLYAELRRLSAADVIGAWGHWRDVRDELFRTHPQSPVPEGSRASFEARYFDYDPALRFPAVALEPEPEPAIESSQAAPLTLPSSGVDALSFRRVGWITVPLPDGTRRLSVFWMEGYAGGLFVPFRDATNGRQTYGAGRYLVDAAKSADLGGDRRRGTIVIDFNFAYQPSCAFDPKWACPLAPPENRLDVPVRAGERIA